MISKLTQRLPWEIKAIKGGRSAEFYFGGDVTLNSAVISNGHATTTTLVEIGDRRRNQSDHSFYIQCPGGDTVVFEKDVWFQYGFRVVTGATAKATITFTNGSEGR